MDDFSIGSGSIKGEQRAAKALDKWMTKNQHLQIKETTGIIKLLPIEEEKRRRNLPRPGKGAYRCWTWQDTESAEHTSRSGGAYSKGQDDS